MSKYYQATSQNRNRISVKKYIRFERDLLDSIETVKSGNENFSAWVKNACWASIANSKETRTTNPTAASFPLSEITPSLELIAEMNRNGFFNRQIADELDQRGLLSPKGKRWTRTAVKEVLDEQNAQ